MPLTRRELGKLGLAALPGMSVLARLDAFQSKPNSKVRGVQIGLNVPYSFGNNLMSADETLQKCVQLGVSALELRSQPVEGFLGATDLLTRAATRGSAPEQTATKKGAEDELRKWRPTVQMDKVKAFRKKYEDAGVLIEIVKFDAFYARPDAELDYCFQLAKTLGARAISTEISVDETKRIGQFADKHGLMVGYHGHMETGPAEWEKAFSFAKHNGANLDIGHFVAGGHGSPIPFLKDHHDRITHIHVKDRKKDKGANTPFGQGDTPVREVLQLLRDNKWPIQATIEFEYPVPEGSDRMKEIAKCVQFCREALA